MANIFQSVPMKQPNRSAFNMSHEVKMSMKMGKLIPFFCQDVVPGDKFRLNAEIFMRFAPMLAPIMHRVSVYTHFFFVPNRIIWNEWEDFITGGEDGQATPVFPFVKSSNLGDRLVKSSLLDYMGLPVKSDPSDPNPWHADSKVSVLPFRAYTMIYNEYYRDQNLTPKVDFDIDSGELPLDNYGIFDLRDRCWEKDYFTSALPWTQRGGDVHLPMTGDADIYRVPGTSTPVVRNNGSSFSGGSLLVTSSGGKSYMAKDFSPIEPISIDPTGNLKADMSSVTAATINELREAISLQQWLETNARGGSRYIEQIMAHFGVRSSDGRLQRPEYLGGGKNPVVISEVLQTSSTDDTSPQANMSGHATSVGNSNRFLKFFEEHGQVIGIISVLPRTAYQQGIPKQFTKFDKFDYYFPEFAHLGEQPIMTQELYAGAVTKPDEVFGYTPRYAEYKYVPSSVHGDFRGNLDYWHMGRKFGMKPQLNSTFVNSDPTKRIFAVTDQNEDELYVQIYNNFVAVRPMPKYGVPRI